MDTTAPTGDAEVEAFLDRYAEALVVDTSPPG